jgi:hypothetical protein
MLTSADPRFVEKPQTFRVMSRRISSKYFCERSAAEQKRGITRKSLICTALGLAFGLLSETTDADQWNAQCTLVTGPNAGQVVVVTINPAPPINAPCSVGSDRGYISRTSAPIGNIGCQCTLFTGPNVGKWFPYEGALPLASACKVGTDRGYISRTSLNQPYNEIFGGQSHHGSSTDPNFVCTVQVNGRTWDVPSVRVPPPAFGAPCQAGGVTGRVSRTSAK